MNQHVITRQVVLAFDYPRAGITAMVKDLPGAVLADRAVHHVYRQRDWRIAAMGIRE